MLNKARGEVELKVDGRSYILRPSFKVLSAIEDATQKSTMELLAGIRSGRPLMKDIVVTLWVAAHGNKDNRDVPGVEDFGESIRRKEGLIKVGSVMLAFLGSSVATDEQLKDAIEQEEESDTKDADPSQPSEDLNKDETSKTDPSN